MFCTEGFALFFNFYKFLSGCSYCSQVSKQQSTLSLMMLDTNMQSLVHSDCVGLHLYFVNV